MGVSKTPRMATDSLGKIIVHGATPTVETKEPPAIRLYSYREPHVRRMCQMLLNNVAILDYSTTGQGKTFTSSAVASLFRMPIIVVAPPTVLNVWKSMPQQGVVIQDMISYEMLRGRCTSGCNNPYLNRKGSQFTATSYLRQVIDQGVLFVFDEMSALKNEGTGRLQSAKTIVRELARHPTQSRAILVSALPTCKDKQIYSVLQMLGIVLSDKMYSYNQVRQEYQPHGWQELLDWCMARDLETTHKILENTKRVTKHNIDNLSIKLYEQVVSSQISSCMTKERSHVDIRNLYVHIPEEDMDTMRQGQRYLSNSTRYFGDSASVKKGKDNWRDFTYGLQLMGTAKLRAICRIAYLKLSENLDSKGIICCWYKDQIKWLTTMFSGYGALSLYGDTKNRDKVIKIFQAPDNRCRMLIINPTVGGIGINLDDRYGDRPRWMILVPDYRMMELVQCTGRIDRESTKSKDQTWIRFVYASQFTGESKILTNLLIKSSSARAVISTDSGIILPDNYKEEAEVGRPEMPFKLPNPPIPKRPILSIANESRL